MLFIGVMLRQGMVCPLDIVPLLVALQGDPEAPIRMSALQLLLIEDEKHPTFLDNRIAGIIYHHNTLLNSAHLSFTHLSLR